MGFMILFERQSREGGRWGAVEICHEGERWDGV